MMSISIDLSVLKGLDHLKRTPGSSKGIVTSYRRTGKIAMITVSMPTKAMNKNASNAMKNRATSQLLTTLGNWVNANLRQLQDSGLEEIRLVPVVDSYLSRLNRQASGGKFTLDHSELRGDGLVSVPKSTQWQHDPGDNYLHLYLPKVIKAPKTSKQYLEEIKQRLKKD